MTALRSFGAEEINRIRQNQATSQILGLRRTVVWNLLVVLDRHFVGLRFKFVD